MLYRLEGTEWIRRLLAVLQCTCKGPRTRGLGKMRRVFWYVFCFIIFINTLIRGALGSFQGY